MSEPQKEFCPECQDHVEPVDRRDFIRVVGGSAAALAVAGAVSATVAPQQALAFPPATPAIHTPRPAELLVRELYGNLSAEQRAQVVHPWNHGATGNQLATRLRMYNAAIGRRIGQVHTPAQQDLIRNILRAICSDEEGYRRITRNHTFDGSGSFGNCGSDIFGDPTQGQFSWVFSGHHLTVRCDGNSEPGAAFGGPMYYGHSPSGDSARNVFYYQTQSVRRVFDALSAQQRQQAVLNGSPGELYPSIRFRPAGQARPGLPGTALSADQRQLVQQVMRDLVSPYRQEDADEVMEIVRRNGGMEQIHLAFYRERAGAQDTQWHFWRLEGPGFVWNYRVLPHVHTYVNIAALS